MSPADPGAIVVDGSRDEAEQVRLLRVAFRPTARVLRIAGAVFVVLGVLALAAPDTLGYLVGLIVLGVGLGLVLRTFLSPRRAARRYRRTAQLPRTIEVTPEFVRVTTPITVMQWAWPAITRATVAGGFWLFYANSVAVVAIPRDRLTEQQEAWLRDLVARSVTPAGTPRSGEAGPSLRASIPDRGE
ncbi:MAG TPA: YcxB family protein [Micromonosporaceae bacterium]